MRAALVTGASRGIGLGIARDLARNGWALTVTSRTEADLAAVADELRGLGSPRVTHLAGDLADPDALKALVATHAGAHRSLDALILNGGVGTAGALGEVSERRVRKTVDVNLVSAITLVQECLPHLRASATDERAARVVMLASIAGVHAAPGLAVYGATKAALVSLASSLSAEEGPGGVLATAVCPAFVDTDMTAWVHERIPPAQMIPVADVVAVVTTVLGLHRSTSIPEVVMARSRGGPHEA